MFYFLMQSFLTYQWMLIMAAVIPAIVLMIYVYKSDRIEKESPGLLIKLVEAGILAALLALIEENIGGWILSLFISEESPAYNAVMFFGVVAISEESSKYLLMKKRTWTNPEFNCQYDGVVYALFTSLGFALWENISYVLSYGFTTALVRAVTAIPGHASFGVFMGVFYGAAKKAEVAGNESESKVLRVIGVIFAVIMHGSYDYLATLQEEGGSQFFWIFMIILFIGAFFIVRKASERDSHFRKNEN